MKLATRERAFYRACPLVEVVCQLRFPTQLALQEALPVAFQRELASDYPILQTREAIHIALPALMDGGEPPRPQVRTGAYDFFDAAGATKVTLAPDFVAVTTSKYENWEVFKQHVERALTAFVQCYEPKLFLRIGLRYQNIIKPAAYGLKRSRPTALFAKEILGPVVLMGDRVREHQSVTMIDLGDGGAANVRFAMGPEASTGSVDYVIDCDVYTEGAEKADKNVSLGTLERFHTEASDIFRWCIKERLHKAFEPEPC